MIQELPHEKEKQKDNELEKDIVNLVVARLETIPSKVFLSVGGDDAFRTQELIDHVKGGSDIGRKVIEMQLEYLRSLSELPIDEDVSSNHEAPTR